MHAFVNRRTGELYSSTNELLGKAEECDGNLCRFASSQLDCSAGHDRHAKPSCVPDSSGVVRGLGSIEAGVSLPLQEERFG